MANTEKDFRSGYGKLVASIWANPAELTKLKNNPQQVLQQYGIESKAGAKVRVVEMVPTGQGTFEEQWQDWQSGDKTGTYDLFVPSKPSSVGPGGAAADVSTTCTPCCTCT